MNDEPKPFVHFVRDETRVPDAQAHAVRVIVLPIAAASFMMLVIAAAAIPADRRPQLPQVIPPVVEANIAHLLSLQPAEPVAIGTDAEDVEADLGAIQRMLRQQDAVGLVARVTQDADGHLVLQPLMEREADRATHAASAIKMLTASAAWSLIVPLAERAGMTPMEYMQATILTVDAEAAAQPGSRFTLREGDQISLLGALYSMAGLSANDGTLVVLNSFIGQQTDMAPLDYINQYAETMGMTETHVNYANGLYASDVDGKLPDNTTRASDMARLAAHIAFNQPELAGLFNQPYYTVVTSGRVPDDDQVTAQQLDNGDYNVTFRTSVQAQLTSSPAGRRLSDTARNAMDFAKTGFTADGEINGGRIIGAFHGPDGALYVAYYGEIGNHANGAAQVFEGLRRFPSVSLALGRTVEAVWRGYDPAPERRVDQLPAALAIMLPDDTFCVGRAQVQGTDIERCPRGETRLARN